jgi:redox-sensitive bicupin YhaK (pirin superfamily)
MIQVRPSDARGHFDMGWLDTHHTFSFADYYDPRFMGFRALRVINDDRVKPSAGFPTHPHRDMEIISVVLGGTIAHQDSMGNQTLIRKGEVQRMTAGTGVRHSEWNPSKDEELHLMQIWILPERQGLTPGYEQKEFHAEARPGELVPIAMPNPSDGAMKIHQDVTLYGAHLNQGQSLRHAIASGRHAWVQVTGGELSVNGQKLREGDGAAISDEEAVSLSSDRGADLLLFDLA